MYKGKLPSNLLVANILENPCARVFTECFHEKRWVTGYFMIESLGHQGSCLGSLTSVVYVFVQFVGKMPVLLYIVNTFEK